MDRPGNHQQVKQAQSGAARAALLGISDGLVTNASLVLGLAGAGASPGVIRVAGVASLIAGAFSMALGEYVSMRGHIELLSGVLARERTELDRDSGAARAELKQILLRDGLSERTAEAASAEIAAQPERAMAFYARGKLGINPDELGSAWKSAGSSFVTFAVGAFVPLLPWYVWSGSSAVVASIGLSMVASLAIGGYLGFATNGHPLKAAIRQLVVLAVAAGVTYAIGRLFSLNPF